MVVGGVGTKTLFLSHRSAAVCQRPGKGGSIGGHSGKEKDTEESDREGGEWEPTMWGTLFHNVGDTFPQKWGDTVGVPPVVGSTLARKEAEECHSFNLFCGGLWKSNLLCTTEEDVYFCIFVSWRGVDCCDVVD